MSLRLRDGPRGTKRRDAAAATAARPAVASDASDGDDSSTLFPKGKTLDGLLHSVLHPSPPPSRRPNEVEEQDIWTTSGDLESHAESTAVNSLHWLPIATPSQIRAKAPRAALKQHLNNDNRRGTTPLSPTNKEEQEDDDDDITLDLNRPIDQVFVYSEPRMGGLSANSNRFSATAPSSSSTPSHHGQQRRRRPQSYRTGERNSATATNSTTRNMNVTSSVDGILDTLGLGTATFNSGPALDSPSSKRAYKRNTMTPFGSFPTRLPMTSTNGKVNGRAISMVVLLFMILYLQFVALGEQEQFAVPHHQQQQQQQHQEQHQYQENQHYYENEHEEGIDRPIRNAELLSKMHQRPNPQQQQQQREPNHVAMRQAKVATARDGPKHFMDGPKPLLAAPKQFVASPNFDKEGAPVDKLPEQPEPEQEEKVMVPYEIQSGLAGTYTNDKNHDNIPFLWYIPRSGGGMIKNICSQCMGLTVASEVGGTATTVEQTGLEVVSVGGHKYVNVDTTTEVGIAKAKRLGLAASGLAQLVVSPRIRSASTLFDSKKGRTIALLRHPVERSASMFFFLQKHNVPAVAKMTIEEYAKSPHVENNWMVRYLSGTMEGEVGDKELDIAKEILRTKVVVGLLERKEESMQRFAWYFGWPSGEGKLNACQTRILTGDYRTNESAKSKVKEGSQAWSLLLWQNKLDMKLYKYAKALFLQQATELFTEMRDVN